MRVLITGSSGRVGSELCPVLAKWFDLRLLDIRPVKNPPGEFVQGSIANRRDMKKALKDVDAIVHLVMANDSAPKAVYEKNCWSVHTRAVRASLEATEAAGVKRFVYTSTLSLYDCVPLDLDNPITEATSPRVDGIYAVTKYLGEELVRHYSFQHTLSAVSLRLTLPTGKGAWAELEASGTARPWIHTHIEDVAEAYRLAISYPTDTFEAFNIASDVTPSRYDITKAKTVLGYKSNHHLQGT